MSVHRLILLVAIARFVVVSVFGQSSIPLPNRTIVKLLADPGRPRIYALNEGPGTKPGTLLALASTNGALLGELSLGLKPSDMAIAADGTSLYAVNKAARTVTKVDLETLALAGLRSISTPGTYDPANPLHLAAGAGNLIYHTDGGWAPTLYTVDFATGEVLSSYGSDSGVGGVAATRDGRTLYTWTQYGWNAGNVNSWVTRLDASGRNLVPQETSFVSWRRDPFDTPILLDARETLVFNKRQVFAATNLTLLLREFEEDIYAISPRGDLAFGNTRMFLATTGIARTNLPFATTIQAVSEDGLALFLHRSNPSEIVLQPISLLAGAGWETNQPPTARFTWSAPRPTTRTLLTFDARGSTDDQGGEGALEYRWDWESDGTFDVPFTNSPLASYHFGIAGTKTVTLEVRDRYGTTGSVRTSFDVVFEEDPGIPGSGGAVFELPFAAADLVFDPTRPRAYATSYTQKSLAILNLETGLVDRTYEFDWSAESVAISPDGRRLAVALLRRPHSSYWFGGHTNAIAVFDLERDTKIGQFQVESDPFGLALTDRGILIVTSGSDQWTSALTYDVAKGLPLSTNMIRQLSRVSLHPSQAAFYTADTDSSPSDLKRYTFDPASGAITAAWDSPYHGDYPMSGRVWCHPQGSFVVSGGGIVLTSSPERDRDLRFVGRLEAGNVEGATFDYAHHALFTVARDRWSYYNADSYELIASQAATNAATFVHARDRHLYLAGIVGSKTLFVRVDNPAIGAETNQAPTPSFTWAPTSATTQTTLVLDASTSADDQGDGPALQYRWDWNNDGAFDTPYTNSPTTSFRFNTAGSKRVTLQVKDRYGATALVTRDLDIVESSDPGQPGTGNPSFEIQFPATAVAFDPVRDLAYVTGNAQKTLVVLNLTNGLVTRRFTFDTSPESIAISPDGRRMYVALLRRPHSSYWFGGHSNDIAEFDLELQVKRREFPVEADPFDLAVTDAGILVVPGGSDQWTDLRTYRAATGELLSTTGIRQASHVTLHPSQNAVYTADTDSSPSEINRIAFDPITGAILSAWDSPYHGDYPMSGRAWCDPRGIYVLARGGHLFTSATDREHDLRYVRSLSGGTIDAAAYDVSRGALFTVSDGKLWQFDLDYELALSRPLGFGAQYLHASPRFLTAAGTTTGTTVFRRFANPALPEPGIQEQPENQELPQGSALFLTVLASGKPPLAYQWYRGGDPLPGQTNATLIANNLQAADEADYVVVVTNAFGSVTSRVAQVRIQVAPSITRSPQSVTTSFGSTLELGVEARGTTPLTFQWTLDGLDLPGATQPTLVLSNLTSASAGSYRVRVQNLIGSALSASAIVRVLPGAPTLVSTPTELVAWAGTNVTLRAEARGSAPLAFQWFLEGNPLPDAHDASLTLQNVQAGDAGTYTVRISNPLGSISGEILRLSVNPAAPWFVETPTSLRQPAGTRAVLLARALGSEPIEYRWEHQGTNLLNAPPGMLVFPQLSLEHAGSYRVIVANAFGSSTSSVATVVVDAVRPGILRQPTDTLVQVGGTLALLSGASGTPPLSLTWYHDGVAISNASSATLTRPRVTLDDAGQYFLVVSNPYGTATSRVAVVTVATQPRWVVTPTNTLADSGTTVTLVAQAQSPVPQTYAWKLDGVLLPGSTSATLTLSNAQPVHAGVYEVVASNAYGSIRAHALLTVIGPPSLVVAWGDDSGAQTTLPGDLGDIVQVAGGDFQSLALHRDGTLVGWGYLPAADAAPPAAATNIVAIAAGASHNLALRFDGRVFAWGNDDWNQASVPGNVDAVRAIAAGEAHSVALGIDGTVVAWGDDSHGQLHPPQGFGYPIRLAAGRHHTLELLSDGTVVGWGGNWAGQATVPADLPKAVAIAAGYEHSLALTAQGRVVGWGSDASGQATPPPGLTNVVAIAAGELHSLALLADGRVVGWGDNRFRQLDFPRAAGATLQIAAGAYHGLALVPPVLLHSLSSEGLQLRWQGSYRLQTASELSGPFEDVTATSPYTAPVTAKAQRFFRLRSRP